MVDWSSDETKRYGGISSSAVGFLFQNVTDGWKGREGREITLCVLEPLRRLSCPLSKMTETSDRIDSIVSWG